MLRAGRPVARLQEPLESWHQLEYMRELHAGSLHTAEALKKAGHDMLKRQQGEHDKQSIAAKYIYVRGGRWEAGLCRCASAAALGPRTPRGADMTLALKKFGESVQKLALAGEDNEARPRAVDDPIRRRTRRPLSHARLSSRPARRRARCRVVSQSVQDALGHVAQQIESATPDLAEQVNTKRT